MSLAAAEVSYQRYESLKGHVGEMVRTGLTRQDTAIS